MQEVPSDLIALKLWWAMTWRIVPFAILAGMAAGFVIGIIATVTQTPPEAMQGAATLAGAAIGIFLTVKIIKRLMTKGFGDYRLVVEKK